MSSHPGPPAAPRPVRLRTVALPAEHGSWSLVAEPILLGLLVAPAWSSLAWALAAFMAFLAYQPLSFVWRAVRRDGRRHKWHPRTRLAARVALLYALLGALCLAWALWLTGGAPLRPLGLALPLLALFAVYDQKPGRRWQAELSAPAAFAAIVAAMALAAQWPTAVAYALWGVMAARALPAVLYVRARLRLVKGQPAQTGLALGAHALAVGLGGALVWLGWLPATAVIALLILLLRAAGGLSPYRRNISTKTLGFIETGYGLLTVLLVAAGFWLG